MLIQYIKFKVKNSNNVNFAEIYLFPPPKIFKWLINKKWYCMKVDLILCHIIELRCKNIGHNSISDTFTCYVINIHWLNPIWSKISFENFTGNFCSFFQLEKRKFFKIFSICNKLTILSLPVLNFN